ncbi:MAG: hypothetical protein H6R17_373 [Proteobacteria bacterium]|nr:hypothetical protein [Pseudomonadota bacterium]
MDKKTHFDFVTSIGLMILSLVMIVDSYRMGVDVGGALYASPGMLPMVLALLLLLTSAMLLKRSIRNGGARQNLAGFVAWFDIFRKSRMAREMMVGALILALYTFVLAPRLPFWMSTSMFMILLMAILKATSLVKNLMITALVVGSIYGVFQMVFHVPLP